MKKLILFGLLIFSLLTSAEAIEYTNISVNNTPWQGYQYVNLSVPTGETIFLEYDSWLNGTANITSSGNITSVLVTINVPENITIGLYQQQINWTATTLSDQIIFNIYMTNVSIGPSNLLIRIFEEFQPKVPVANVNITLFNFQDKLFYDNKLTDINGQATFQVDSNNCYDTFLWKDLYAPILHKICTTDGNMEVNLTIRYTNASVGLYPQKSSYTIDSKEIIFINIPNTPEEFARWVSTYNPDKISELQKQINDERTLTDSCLVDKSGISSKVGNLENTIIDLNDTVLFQNSTIYAISMELINLGKLKKWTWIAFFGWLFLIILTLIHFEWWPSKGGAI